MAICRGRTIRPERTAATTVLTCKRPFRADLEGPSLRIAVIGPKGLPPGQGGIEHHSAELYPRMVRRGHEVDLFARASYLEGGAWAKSSFGGVNITALPCPGMRGVDALASSLLGASMTLGRYDVIHFHGLGPAIFSWLPRLASRASVVVTCHGLDWQRAKWGGLSTRAIRAGEQVAVRAAHTIIVMSEALRTYFRAEHGRETVLIPNAPASYPSPSKPFDRHAFFGLERGRYVLFLGRIVPEKRPDLALDAFRALAPAGWKMAFVGESSDTDDYVATLRRRAAGDDAVVFTGERRGEALAELMRGAGLFILPSDLEGLPLAMLEAMAQGVPVVASDIAPHRELIGQDRGVLFAAGDGASCTAALGWAMANGNEMRRRASRARDHVESRFDWDRITDQTLATYGA